jgi:hypothetical protein
MFPEDQSLNVVIPKCMYWTKKSGRLQTQSTKRIQMLPFRRIVIFLLHLELFERAHPASVSLNASDESSLPGRRKHLTEGEIEAGK